MSSCIETGSAAFLQQAHRNNWQRYLASLEPGSPAGWDICVLTASDEHQATMYRRQLEQRRETRLLPAHTRFIVIADPDSKRIGSGGATLRVLAALADPNLESHCFNLSADLADLIASRVLIIHSGGDSRRLPHSSATGKLFARVPRTLPDGRASTLFDEFLIGLSGLATDLPAGVLIASGDVLLVFDHLQLSFQRIGVIGVAAAAPVEMSSHHGVYVCGNGTHSVHAYLHKPDAQKLMHWNAIRNGSVQIDTGLVWLDASTSLRFAQLTQEEPVAALCGMRTQKQALSGALNLYGDLLLPLAQSTAFESYLADTSDGPATPDVQAARRVIWNKVRDVPFTVEQLQPAVFIHFGTSGEYWQTVTSEPMLRQICGWTDHASAWLISKLVEDTIGPVLINAAVEGDIQVASQPTLIVDSYLAGPAAWRGAAIVAGVHTAKPLALAENVVVHQLPVEGGFVTRIYGLNDDPKREWDDPTARFMNCSWATWLAEAGIAADVIWPSVPESERTLWNAQLYPVVVDRGESLKLALPLQEPATASQDWRAAWQVANRLSLGQSFARADSERILADMAAVEDRVSSCRFYAAIIAEQSASEARRLLGSVPGVIERRGQQVALRLYEADPIVRLRGYKALAAATGKNAWEEKAFATLAEMIEADVRNRWAEVACRRQDTAGKRLIKCGEAIPVKAAARIDFGGGWTDTPPYSIERGGTVLNAAIMLRGTYPIAAEAACLDQPKIVLESRDIEASVEPQCVGDVLNYATQADPFALHKAALVIRGIVPLDCDPRIPIFDLMPSCGAGIRLSTETTVPRGSGLGTSSILAGATLASLAHLQGFEPTQSQLFDEVLLLEQMLTTGGGWQDQVGGLTGGIKLVTTQPGLSQRIQIEPVQLSPETRGELSSRLLLVYTGQQRLAKNLLQSMMRQWMARDPKMVWILREIAQLALEMRDALANGCIDTFGELLAKHWELNKRMDLGCTNPFIDGLFETMKPYIRGGKLAGAGGGGFAIVVARDRQAAHDLSVRLGMCFPDTLVGVWPSAIPELSIVGGSRRQQFT